MACVINGQQLSQYSESLTHSQARQGQEPASVEAQKLLERDF